VPPEVHAAGPRKPIWRWLLLALLIILLDQVTKIGFDQMLDYGQRIAVLPVFDFTLLYNRGAAFSFLASHGGWQRWLFTGIGMVAAVVIIWLLRRHSREPLFCAALTLILGGALGNVIDRLVHGYVIDFILLHWNDRYFPAFNLADMAITAGAVALVLDEWLKVRRGRAAARDAG